MEDFAVTCPLAPDASRLISGFCSPDRVRGRLCVRPRLRTALRTPTRAPTMTGRRVVCLMFRLHPPYRRGRTPTKHPAPRLRGGRRTPFVRYRSLSSWAPSRRATFGASGLSARLDQDLTQPRFSSLSNPPANLAVPSGLPLVRSTGLLSTSLFSRVAV
jgi:hypothetical protein